MILIITNNITLVNHEIIQSKAMVLTCINIVFGHLGIAEKAGNTNLSVDIVTVTHSADMEEQ